MSQILIKYSQITAAPSTLGEGELAYSSLVEKLYIGTANGVVHIGGKELVDRVGVIEGDVTQLKLDRNSHDANIRALLAAVTAAGGLVDTVADHGQRITDVESALGLGAGGGTPTFANLSVTGDLTVGGKMTVVNTEEISIKDPVIHLGEGTVGADGLDRGVSFSHFDGASNSVKTGFFGMDGADGKFKFLPDATDKNATGIIVGNVEGSATSLATAQTIDLGGEASGSVSFNGTAAVTLAVTIAANSNAVAEKLVRRDASGSAKFNSIETATVANMLGGADFKGAHLQNAIINGGTF